jgi:hypothetical protein
MHFDLHKSIEILERTPPLLHQWLNGLSHEWTHEKPQGEDWSVFDVIGHLIHGEKTDWIPRMQIILSDSPDKHFVPFDRFAQFEASKGKTLIQLLDEFAVCKPASKRPGKRRPAS